MTNEEWIEEIFIKAAEIGKYTELHEILDELKKSHVNMSFLKRLEIAYEEITKQNQASIEVVG